MNTIKNIAECVDLATQLKRDWFPQEPTWGPWFRGPQRCRMEIDAETLSSEISEARNQGR
jgi:hypothetical protein